MERTWSRAPETPSPGAAAALGLTLNGEGGDDTLAGGADADTLSGGPGNDQFDEGDASNGADTMAGGAGVDDRVTYAARTARVVVTMDATADDGEVGEADSVGADVESAFGGASDDLLVGGATANDLTGGAGDDTIDGGAGDDTLNGGLGLDRLTGGAGNDTVFGDDDDDTILDGAGNDNIDGGTGVDSLDYSGVTAGVTMSLADSTAQPTGGAGTDTVTGLENLTGGTGADVLGGDAGANVLTGGAGTDTADYSAFGGGVSINLSLAGPQNTGTAGIDTLVTLESATGGTGNDTITGEAGTNVLNGGDGADTLAGLRGNDTLDGGPGVDTLDYSAAEAGVTVNLASLAAQNTGGAGTDTLLAAENVIGSSFGDVLLGTVGDNVLDGGPGIDAADYSSFALGVTVDLSVAGAQGTGTAGNDALMAMENVTGGSGRDTLTGTVGPNSLAGGAGNDLLMATAGADVLDGGAGSDTVDYSSRPPGVVVNLTSGTAASAGDVDLLTTVENATGSSGADLLTGDGAVNTLEGGDGNDRLRGLAGADSLSGGGGVDTVDYATFFPTNGRVGVVVNLAAGEAVGDGADSLALIENATGSSFDDRLLGNSLGNTLQGGDGNDYLSGGRGQDVLRGGDDADTIQARDGIRDRVFGDAGRDRARVDRRRDVVRGVEIRLR